MGVGVAALPMPITYWSGYRAMSERSSIAQDGIELISCAPSLPAGNNNKTKRKKHAVKFLLISFSILNFYKNYHRDTETQRNILASNLTLDT